eukprot:CAMPEP_0194282400 /NCGR_PEP_ID=MMETSP0169-20130528/22995_1 /TAXON_ID=218684 /ORGANISM="Corethron pennatum, Strain L29A3" /LENGTH=630 /DNA_ID=CAMNT_0039027697 /DNA_START=274 /DNA_END=2166 /DNA_ORIENTATION=-
MRILMMSPAALALFLSAVPTPSDAFGPTSSHKCRGPSGGARRTVVRPLPPRPRSSVNPLFSTETEPSALASSDSSSGSVPDADALSAVVRNDNGVYQFENEAQYRAFLQANPDRLTLLKFYAPWCRACKGLAPKYGAVAQDPSNSEVRFAEMSIQYNKDFVKGLGVLALPSVHFYVGESIADNFPCGPSKVPILKRKLAEFKKKYVGEDGKVVTAKEENDCVDESVPCITRIGGKEEGIAVTAEQVLTIRNISYFKDMPDEDFQRILEMATIMTFEAGDVICKQGREGVSFFVLAEGEVEILTRTGFEDPLTTPSSYLGASINTLRPMEYFGERSLITGEVRAASIKAATKTKCFAFKGYEMPVTTILAGRERAELEYVAKADLAAVDEKYGTGMFMDEFSLQNISVASQKRGSVNSPDKILGVDTDDEIVEDEASLVIEDSRRSLLPLLVKFKLIRQGARCFEYVTKNKVTLGDVNGQYRRSLLVNRLTESQKAEFKEVFNLIDASNDGFISLLELKRVMESTGQPKSDDELNSIFEAVHPGVEASAEIDYDEFIGMMAEAEFYYLFVETFEYLDKQGSGFIRAGDITSAITGMESFISVEKTNFLKVDDDDMLINYEQFSKMLLGSAL